ncbi:MAG: ROK family protein [Chloroflexi bacterium]|nr:ROK family protein [Chloroflexota bacterium]
MVGQKIPVLAVDLGGTQLRVALVGADGQITFRYNTLTKAEEGLEAVLERIYTVITQGLLAAGNGGVTSIALSVPGPVNPYSGVIFRPPNMPGWDEVPLKQLVEQRFHLPTHIGNDANVAALGEHRFGAGQGIAHLIYLTVSTGIGGGVISNGQLLLGYGGFAAEPGHMTIDRNGPICGCGNVGCLEALASGTAIARHAKERLLKGEDSRLRAVLDAGLEQISAELVAEAAKAGDGLALTVIEEAATNLGIGVVNLVHIFNPQLIIIGGGVARAGDLLFEPVRRIVRERTMRIFQKELDIVPAALGDDVCLLGAATLALAVE